MSDIKVPLYEKLQEVSAEIDEEHAAAKRAQLKNIQTEIYKLLGMLQELGK